MIRHRYVRCHAITALKNVTRRPGCGRRCWSFWENYKKPTKLYVLVLEALKCFGLRVQGWPLDSLGRAQAYDWGEVSVYILDIFGCIILPNWIKFNLYVYYIAYSGNSNKMFRHLESASANSTTRIPNSSCDFLSMEWVRNTTNTVHLNSSRQRVSWLS